MTRVPQFRIPVVVWLDLGGMYSVASHAGCRNQPGCAQAGTAAGVTVGVAVNHQEARPLRPQEDRAH
jgi:hypothetical protein